MTHQNKEGLEASAVAFLLEMATYFERRPTNGEDMAFWANVTNKRNCEGIASLVSSLREENERLRKALEKVDAIRNSIIGFQNVGWPDHIYPLVAALEDAGFNGKGYDVMRTEIRTMLEAERQLSASQAQLKIYREALVEAIDGYAECSQYKGDYLRKKHGDDEDIARLRTLSQNQEQSE